MKQKNLHLTMLASTMLTAALSASPVHAQDTPVEIIPDNTASASNTGDDIVVTGSRIRRNNYTSISPVQTIDASVSRNLGLTDTSDLVTQSPLVTGPQLDGTVNSGSPTAAVEGVPVNGPGAATVALRGLGSERTLLLVNGRRLAPSGVRGAPVSPDLNLIPSTMIDRVEILTDGASSIYGADAVAGVANIILKKEFEGLELSSNFSLPEEDGGETVQLGLIGGASTDRSNFTIAAEFFEREAVIAGDRLDSNDCLRDIEVGESGEIYSACLDGRPDNAVFIGSQGFVFSTPGTTDIGVPGFTSIAGLPGNFRQDATYNLQDEELDTQLREELKRVNLFATGEFELDFWSRDSLYFEASYAQRESVGRFTSEQIFPGVPGSIPMEDANGNLLVNPDGSLQLFDNPLNPFNEDALPVITTQALAQLRSTELQNFRFVGGLEGDLALGGLGEKNWVYDVNMSYDRSYGTASQPILRENAIRESLDTLRIDANGNLTCGLPRTATSFGFLTPQDCVVVNFFSPSLFTTLGGDKSFSLDETNFLAANSINTTEIEQTVYSAIITGDVVDVPAGTVALVLGGEFRDQKISSVNDGSRVNGNGASEIPDTEGNTIGSTNLLEFFAETEIPVFDGFVTNFSGRYTDEQNFGDEFTYSAKARWDVTDFFSLRGTYGTTFRAPNLREQFLANQTATIGGGNDPCLVPNEANNGGVYDPTAETRDQIVLDNCFADGADPTALGLLATTGITTSTGGNTNLVAETSDSLTLGFTFSQPWSDDYDFDLAVTYFDIEVSDTVEESSAVNTLQRCYNDFANLASPFCGFITRNTGNPATATISNVDAGFINVGLVTSSGIDVNTRFQKSLDNLWSGADFAFNFTGTYYIEQLEQIDPTAPIDDNVGEIGTPELAMQATAAVSKDNWRATWRTRFIDSVQQDNSDPFAANTGRRATRDACGVLNVVEMCRDVDFAGSVWYHDAAFTWDQDDWSVSFGINNLFNKRPPLIDQGEGPSRLNIVVQSGYDVIGRRAFANLTKRF